MVERISPPEEQRELPPGEHAHWRHVAALWFAVLGPLAAAWGQQQLAYSWVPLACKTGNVLLLHIPPLLALGVAGLAAAISWREYRESRDPAEKGQSPRSSEFFGVTGLILSGLSAALILGFWLPNFFLHPCQI